MDEMTNRQRFGAVMNFRPFDRLPVVEWAGWWNLTVDRWHREGLPAEANGLDVNRHFGLDLLVQAWIGPRRSDFPPEHPEGGPPVRCMADYERIRPFLYPWPAIDRNWWANWAQKQADGQIVLWFTLDGFFWFPRSLLGIEPHLYAFYDQGELMHRINADLADWLVRVIDEITSICTPDFMTFAEDMSYNHGPMLSKRLFDEFMTPYYHRVIPRLKERGIPAIIDSDGDITTAATWFEQAGLDGILPLERQAGVDVSKLRWAHPKMRFIGCFDKMTMNRGEAAMRGEFERLLPTAAKGGLIVSVDHQTPPGVSYEDYKLYVRLFREYAAEAGRMSRR